MWEEDMTGQLVYVDVHTRNVGPCGGTWAPGGAAGGPE